MQWSITVTAVQSLIHIYVAMVLKHCMEVSCREAVICWHVRLFPPTILSNFVSRTPLSLTHFCCLCMISVLRSPLYLPPASPQPSISRSLYRNRSFLRIPLAARPRFSSLRSLRFVLPRSTKVKGMPSHPAPPSSRCSHASVQFHRGAE